MSDIALGTELWHLQVEVLLRVIEVVPKVLEAGHRQVVQVVGMEPSIGEDRGISMQFLLARG